jgi:hypothetical protein
MVGYLADIQGLFHGQPVEGFNVFQSLDKVKPGAGDAVVDKWVEQKGVVWAG